MNVGTVMYAVSSSTTAYWPQKTLQTVHVEINSSYGVQSIRAKRELQ